MLFSRARFPGRNLAASDTLRALWPTFARPVTFAIPLDVTEDDEGFTLVFDVPNRESIDVAVRVDGHAVRVEGRVEERTFWVGAALESDRVEVEFGDAELRVRVIKARVAAARKIVVRTGR